MTRVHIHTLFLSMLICFLTGFLHAEQLENMVVERINVHFVKEQADSKYSEQQVLGRLKTQQGALFSQSEFDNDLKILACEYDYVEPEVEIVDTNLYISLKIRPKPILRSICWCGNDKIKQRTLEQELGIAKGCLFDRVEFNRAIHNIKGYYIKKGYFESDVDYAVEEDPDFNQVDVVICIDEGRSGRIKDILLSGLTKCEEEEVMEMLFTKKYNFFTSWLTSEGTYNEECIQLDQFRILTYLHNRGYADAQVDIDIIEARQKDRILIHITATKGELYRFGELTFEGNTLFTDDQIAARFTIAEGCPYSPEQLRDTVQSISDLYGRCGYIDAVIDYEAKLIEGQNAYTVNLTIEEGDQYRVGLIKVFGNKTTQTRVILHESLLIPGEVFNINKLKKTEERLINIGYFKCVNVYIAQSNDLLGEDCRYRDVHIEVEEQGTGHFGAFFGFSSAESLFAGFTITEKNFDHRGLSCCWDKGLKTLRGGGEFVHFVTNIGEKASSYGLSWTQPYFCDTPWSIGFDLERSSIRYVSDDYDIRSWGAAFHASYPLDAFTRFGWHYRIRNTDVNVTSNDNNPTLRAEANNGGLISATGVSLTYDSTNSPQCPTNGFRSRLELEYAGLGGDANFWGMAYLNTFYYPLHKKGVVKLRADARFLAPSGGTTRDEIPIDERLFLGGDNQIRGFRPYAIGPKYPGTDEPRGGITMTLLSAEYDRKVFENLDFFAFVDAGQLTRSQLSVDQLYVSTGFGLRLKLMENGPPLTTGFGFPLNAKTRSDVKRFFWALGGRF